MKNSNGTAPPIVLDNSYPPLPPPIDDADIADLSMELNNVHLDENLHGVDDIVPEADPEIDTHVSCRSSSTFVLTNLSPLVQHRFANINPVAAADGPLGQGPHVRRKSVLPGLWFTRFAGQC